MRLIDADRLKGVEDSVLCSRDYARGWNDCIAEARHAPTVDAVEVVRCKDCKHAWRWRDGQFGGCSRIDTILWDAKKDFYCADGEKKEEV